MMELDEDPVPDGWNRWGLGLGVPVVLSGIAMWMATQSSIHLPGRRGGLTLHGSDVIAWALMWAALAVFLHAHFFWTETDRFHFPRQVTRLLAMVVGVIAFGVVLVHQAAVF